ncbi:MAG: GntR family transcriptional regulator [Gammaproteobacteria bacterium]|nr:GntR family transcriptional regulator [Gammaproteobacteria bacterium]
MLNLAENLQRRTTTDLVFDHLHEEIASLKLLPGTKLSETDIAQRFGVSRQPVRDAFNRLENLDLLVIRPQRATEVRRFSMQRIADARFVRLAVELEVVRQACSVWDAERARLLDDNLQQQQQALVDRLPDQFHILDYQFHKSICELSGCASAFNTIEECKKKVTRLCVLSLDRKNEFAVLLEDHLNLALALKKGYVEEATAVTRQHLARLDDTIADIHAKHADYFE